MIASKLDNSVLGDQAADLRAERGYFFVGQQRRLRERRLPRLPGNQRGERLDKYYRQDKDCSGLFH